MASSVIHIAIANELNKKLKKNQTKLLIGSVAPDISKFVFENKFRSHFLEDINNDVPNIEKFLKKYKTKLSDDFVLGYYIHLYTDYLWFKYFITEIINNDYISKLNGETVKLNGGMANLYIYNDYTNLDVQLIDEYNLDLKIIYNDIPVIEPIIEEIPMDKMNVLLNHIGIIIANTKINKEFVFNIENIKKFISTSTEIILSEIKKLDI